MVTVFSVLISRFSSLTTTYSLTLFVTLLVVLTRAEVNWLWLTRLVVSYLMVVLITVKTMTTFTCLIQGFSW